MVRLADPGETYRRVDFDARVAGSDPRALVDLCFEQLIAALARALVAETRGDNALKSASLTRAVAALTALELGVAGEGPTGEALLRLYGAARRAVLDSALRFDRAMLARVRADFAEIRGALAAAG